MKTKMKGFGSSSRVGHDSTDFYSRNLYNQSGVASKPRSIDTENRPKRAILNQIYTHTSESMSELPDNSVHMMITSPPYNVGKDYDDDLSSEDYRQLLKNVWNETFRVLVDGGRACINIANIGRKPYIPLNSMVAQDMTGAGFLMRGEIIWQKGASAGGSCAWGSWLSATNPVLRDTHEYILVFSKGDFSRPTDAKKKSTIEKDEFLEWTKSVWNMTAASAQQVGHPAPFPLELPTRLIKLYSYSDDIILDPFIGSGTTAIASINLDRQWVGYETSQEYTDKANQRIKALQPKMI